MYKRSVVLVALCAVVILLSACGPSSTTAATEVFSIAPYEGEIGTTCTRAAVSVFGQSHPQLSTKIDACTSLLTEKITQNDGWPQPGSAPGLWGNQIANTWGAANGQTLDRILAAMRLSRYSLEDQGLLVRDQSEVRTDPWDILNEQVLFTAPYPWEGSVESGGNLWSTLALICDRYTRSNDQCDEGSEIWHSQAGFDVVILGAQALDYTSAITDLPMMQPGDSVSFGDEATIRGMITGPTLILETEYNSLREGYTTILRAIYPDGRILRQHFNYTSQAWEIVP